MTWVKCRVVDEAGVWFEGIETDHYVGATPSDEDHPLYRLHEGDEVWIDVDADEYPRIIALWRQP